MKYLLTALTLSILLSACGSDSNKGAELEIKYNGTGYIAIKRGDGQWEKLDKGSHSFQGSLNIVTACKKTLPNGNKSISAQVQAVDIKRSVKMDASCEPDTENTREFTLDTNIAGWDVLQAHYTHKGVHSVANTAIEPGIITKIVSKFPKETESTDLYAFIRKQSDNTFYIYKKEGIEITGNASMTLEPEKSGTLYKAKRYTRPIKTNARMSAALLLPDSSAMTLSRLAGSVREDYKIAEPSDFQYSQIWTFNNLSFVLNRADDPEKAYPLKSDPVSFSSNDARVSQDRLSVSFQGREQNFDGTELDSYEMTYSYSSSTESFNVIYSTSSSLLEKDKNPVFKLVKFLELPEYPYSLPSQAIPDGTVPQLSARYYKNLNGKKADITVAILSQ